MKTRIPRKLKKRWLKDVSYIPKMDRAGAQKVRLLITDWCAYQWGWNIYRNPTDPDPVYMTSTHRSLKGYCGTNRNISNG